jgi:hypothetical protein
LGSAPTTDWTPTCADSIFVFDASFCLFLLLTLSYEIT